jgi:ABC-2 type transport system permease protein
MTTVAISQSYRASRAPARRTSLLTGTMLVAKRVLIKFYRTPQLVIGGIMQMALFLIIFRYVFGGAVASTDGVSYVDFLVPGFIATGVFFALIGSAVGVAEDLEQGFIDRLRSLPIPRSSMVTGRVLADTLAATLNLAIATGIGFAVGFRLHGTVLEGLAAFGLCVLLALAFDCVFVTVGLLAKTGQEAQQMSMVVFPFTFLSSAYVPVQTMPSWLRAFAENQPITPMVDAVRALTLGSNAPAVLGHGAGYFVAHALLWTVAIVLVSVPIAVIRYQRG